MLSSLAFNGAMVAAYVASGFGAGPQYLALPVGLSVLALVRVFRHELSEQTDAHLRTAAVLGIYLAAAWTPLTFDAPWALFVCVGVCVVGVAAGIGCALAAGGFAITSLVYVFNVKRFKPIVRPTVLTAFLGYSMAVVGLPIAAAVWAWQALQLTLVVWVPLGG